MNPAPALILVDIDGTLIRRACPHHRQALIDAVRRVTGLETSTDRIPGHGMLDPDILTRMLLDGGVPNLQRKTCPGVGPLLRRLQQRGVLLGLAPP